MTYIDSFTRELEAVVDLLRASEKTDAGIRQKEWDQVASSIEDVFPSSGLAHISGMISGYYEKINDLLDKIAEICNERRR